MVQNVRRYAEVMTRSRNVRGVAREEAILAAAGHLFGTRGFRAVSLREVAAAAGITHSTLLHYFPSKEALLDAVLAAKDLSIAERLRGVHGRQQCVDVFADMKADNLHEPGYVALLMQMIAEAADPDHPAHDRFRARYEDINLHAEQLFQGIGRLAPGLSATDAMRLLVAVSDGLNLQWLYSPGDFDPVALSTVAAELVFDVISPNGDVEMER